MKVSDFDYQLPPELIAQTPVEPRDQSRLMVLHRGSGSLEHRRFRDIIDYVDRGDTLVFNNSRVIPARLYGQLLDSTITVELLLLRRLNNNLWEALARPGRKLNPGTRIYIAGEPTGGKEAITAEVLEHGEGGIKTIRFSDEKALEELGQVPLPPYIRSPLAEPERYQTIYSKVKGSVAAPTAGLHFTEKVMNALQQKGVHLAFVTLHVGLDSFRPVRVEDPGQHIIHREYGELDTETANLLNQTRNSGKRVIAVGTSTVRLIEASARTGTAVPYNGWVDLFILPGYQFVITDAMTTNFHLPRSTLLMLVSAFAGMGFILKAYEEAKNLGYRFYSFGDAMLIF